MKNKFNVTYDIVTPESAEQGDYAESGFLAEHVGLREAIDLVKDHGYIEPSCSPIQHAAFVWFTAIGEQDYRDGSQESRSLHCPKNITRSSHKRVSRLLGLRLP